MKNQSDRDTNNDISNNIEIKNNSKVGVVYNNSDISESKSSETNTNVSTNITDNLHESQIISPEKKSEI